MREYSAFEKRVIEYICTDRAVIAPYSITYILQEFFGSRLLFPRLRDINNGHHFIVTVLLHNAEIEKFKQNNFSSTAFKELLEFIALIDELENNGSIVVSDSGDFIIPKGTKQNKGDYTEVKLNPYYNDKLVRLCCSSLLARYPLIYLVQNDFESIEELRHKEQMRGIQKQVCWAKWAFLIATITFISSLFLSRCSTSVNETQIESINQTIRDSQIETPLNAIIVNDSLPVSKINTGRIPVDVQVFSFPKVIQAEIVNDTLQVKITNEPSVE